MLNTHENWRKESKKVNYKISDRMKRIMNISNTNVNIYDKTPTRQQNSN